MLYNSDNARRILQGHGGFTLIQSLSVNFNHAVVTAKGSFTYPTTFVRQGNDFSILYIRTYIMQN